MPTHHPHQSWLVGLFCLITGTAGAGGEDLPYAAVPGGVVSLKLATPLTATPPKLRFEGQPVWVHREGDAWWAMVGLGLKLAPGEYQLEGMNEAPRFTVKAKTYPRQDITVKNQRHVDPNPADLQRIALDQTAMAKAKAAWSDQAPLAWRLAWPVRGRLSSPFGLKRYFNGQARSPHSGLDIAAPEGTPITAPLAGEVSLVGDLFFNGNTIALHHGQGYSTLYCHLSRIDVALGQRVQAGDIIGAVGKTGRATGPHLHFGVILNGVMVEPSLLLSPQD